MLCRALAAPVYVRVTSVAVAAPVQRIDVYTAGTCVRSGAAAEVCAQSWENQDLLDSCVDCVASWWQSSGHWRAVSGHHAAYGYDIRRGGNGIWYATGIFRE